MTRYKLQTAGPFNVILPYKPIIAQCLRLAFINTIEGEVKKLSSHIKLLSTRQHPETTI